VKILSIQSAVAYGHVGNSAAVFPLQRIGVEVLPVYTVNFSNHTGYGAWRGPLISPDDVRDVIQGIEDRGVLSEIDVVLSGYQGGEGIADVILDAVARVKAANPAAVYSCDPVMGNAKSGCFVAPAIPILLRDRVVPAADIITPNQFELGFITDRDALSGPSSLEDILAAVDEVRGLGPSTVLVTSVDRQGAPDDAIEMLAVTEDGAWLVTTPRLPMKANGSGDITAALFTAHLKDTGSAADALARTASSVFAVLKETLDSGERELRLIAAQHAIADPTGAWIVQTPRLPMKANGSGDVTAALFTAHYVTTGDAKTALERTASSVFDLLAATLESGERELQLVEAQEFYANPRMQFTARQVR
jgi:pyridoxine kinase